MVLWLFLESDYCDQYRGVSNALWLHRGNRHEFAALRKYWMERPTRTMLLKSPYNYQTCSRADEDCSRSQCCAIEILKIYSKHTTTLGTMEEAMDAAAPAFRIPGAKTAWRLTECPTTRVQTKRSRKVNVQSALVHLSATPPNQCPPGRDAWKRRYEPRWDPG